MKSALREPLAPPKLHHHRGHDPELLLRPTLPAPALHFWPAQPRRRSRAFRPRGRSMGSAGRSRAHRCRPCFRLEKPNN